MHEDWNQLVECDGVKGEEAVCEEIDVRLPGKDFPVSRRCLWSDILIIFIRDRFSVLFVYT